MTAEPPGQPPPDVRDTDLAQARTQLAWRVAPLSLAFFLDLVDLGRHRDVLDSLIFGAILIANTQPLAQDPDLAQAYADVREMVPDDLRRPVTINALAQSLRLPFETTRRRIGRMIRSGDIVMTPRGVYVPASAVTTAHFLSLAMRRHERLRRFYLDLNAIEALPHSGAPPPALAPASPLRLTNRSVAEYMLRIADPMIALAGDPAAALVLMQLTHASIAGLEADALAAWARDQSAAGQPIRAGRLAQRLRFSTETTRRQAMSLEAAGFCIRSKAGLIATAPPDARPVIAQMVEDNFVNVQRLFGRLRQLGALAAWDAPRTAAGTAARR